MRRYSNDPRWIKAKYPGTDINGRQFGRGEMVLFYPLNKRIISGEQAQTAFAEFANAAFDESVYSRAMA